jgi:hypothetical protein
MSDRAPLPLRPRRADLPHTMCKLSSIQRVRRCPEHSSAELAFASRRIAYCVCTLHQRTRVAFVFSSGNCVKGLARCNPDRAGIEHRQLAASHVVMAKEVSRVPMLPNYSRSKNRRCTCKREALSGRVRSRWRQESETVRWSLASEGIDRVRGRTHRA